MGNFCKIAVAYWKDPDTNIFNNYVDSVLGIIVLIFIPFISLVSLKNIEEINLISYSYPISTIFWASIYDIYSKYKPTNKLKLQVRGLINIIAFILCLITPSISVKWVAYCAPILLLLSGMFILFDAYIQISYSIRISKWST